MKTHLVDKDEPIKQQSESWKVGEQLIGGIPIYTSDDVHFATISPPITEEDFRRARLIAAAPELLEALYEIRAELKAADESAWYGTEMDRGIGNALKCAYAAIAKATGGAR